VSGEQSNATALVEYFDAGSWSTEPPPIPSGTDALGIGDCETATVPVTCLGVGEGSNPASAAGTSPIAEFWNSSNQDWTITSPVASISSSGTPQGFTDASCPSASWCVAVGAQFTRPLGGAGTPDPLAEAWSGSRWIRMNTVQVSGPINARYSPFAAVSCPSTTFCVAVGNKRVLNNEQPEVASWGTLP
jgi:hypothetical protein